MIRGKGGYGKKAGLAIVAVLAGLGTSTCALAAGPAGSDDAASSVAGSQSEVTTSAPPGGAGQNAAAPTISGIGTPAPPVGVAVRLGDLGSVFGAAGTVGELVPQRPPGFRVTPTLGVQEEFTDNVFGTAGHHQSDFITALSPGLLVNIQTPSIGGTVSYAPSFQWYARHASQNTVAQSLNGAFEATLLPKTLVVSSGAYIAELSTKGGITPGGVSNLPSANRTTTTAFFVTPSFVHQFGDAGTLRLGYSLRLASESGGVGSVAGSTRPFFVNSSALTNQETASYTTGPALGRVNNSIAVVAEEYGGTPILDAAHQYFVVDTLRFAVDRRAYVFGSAGYENIAYPNSLPAFKINGGVWAVGFGLTPAPRSAVIAGYRYAYGIHSPVLRVAIGLTARTRLAIVYSSVVATPIQALQASLSGSTVDAAGNSIDGETGAPVLLANQLLSQQSGLMRNSVLSASLVTTWPRDTLTFSFLHDQQKLLANAPGTAGFSQQSWSGGVGWVHALTPRLTAVSSLQAGSTNSAALGSGWTPTLSGQISLAYRLSRTLSASLVYEVINQWPSGGGNDLQNIAIVALQNTF